jgi:hypothetical protein
MQGIKTTFQTAFERINTIKAINQIKLLFGYILFGLFIIILANYASQINPVDWTNYSKKPFENNAFVWEDDFVSSDNYSIQEPINQQKNLSDGYLAFGEGKNIVQSKCVDFGEKEILGVAIDIYRLKNFETKLYLQNCDNQTKNIENKSLLISHKLQEGKNLFDFKDKNLKNGKFQLRLEILGKRMWGFLPPKKLKLDSWKIFGLNKNLMSINVTPQKQTVISGDNITFEAIFGAKLEQIPESTLSIDMTKTNLSTENPIRKLKLVKLEAENFETNLNLAEDSSGGKVNIKLPKIEIGKKLKLLITLQTEDGFVQGDKIQIMGDINFFMEQSDKSVSIFEKPQIIKQNIEFTSTEAKLEGSGELIQTKYDRYSNLSSDATKLWSLFFLDHKSRDDKNQNGHSDVKNHRLKVKLAEGSCNPVYTSSSIAKLLDNDNFDQNSESKQYNKFNIIKEPVKGRELTANDSIEVNIDYWSFDNIYRGLVINYDIAKSKSCTENTKLRFVSELYKGEELIQTEIIEHQILKNTCVHQLAESRDVIRINQQTFKPDNSYWPEWRIGLEANCSNMNDVRGKQKLSQTSLVGSGEYFLVNYWANEGFRTNTVNLDWLYVNYQIPKGLSFHGTFLDLSEQNKGNFYSTRPANLLNNENNVTEFWKGDTTTALLPEDSKFDHKNPSNSGWYKVDTNQVPLSTKADLNNSGTSVYYEDGKKMTIMTRTKNFSPPWKKDFFLPVFIMKVCDNTEGCKKVPDGTKITTNQMDSFALSSGKCERCGQSKFGTIQIGNGSFASVNLGSDKLEANLNSNINLTITPENQIMASSAVKGNWELDLSRSKEIIDWSSLKTNIVCKGCKLPPKCDITKIKTSVPSIDKPVIMWNFDDATECQPDRGYGLRIRESLCKDGFNSNFDFVVSFNLKTSTSKNNLKNNLNLEAKVTPTNAVDNSIWSEENYKTKLEIKIN